nr:PREDICTED: uncharacterized protein LOC105677243 isoform X1 [Linepithema humile]XP_012231129.1 PREDICTED: uncharacterized protein LOC105677243 isoform X1 [Linepithema humile]XP_012231130.1 PREDICTED: uncharacterized protein LOC105677243 isoform X1 [Linepithema humile]XP_012231132.1 PREDICTED: uncharacterized protein LOC105677243 isoform X1 [Linepithema humile]XP_012231133.1 PREDICTED: uncharacterized protein LOC105677243 isoform X1 [Linepithema humile]
MNRENEEQRPVPQTLCGALQKEPNCKCLVLTVLIYGCLAAVTWCRCANVTKIMVNYTKFPIRSTKHVSSPCDDGYIYIPVAFMGMLYLVYLVECYHSPIRIDLLHAESQDSVLSKLAQLKMAQPRIWWKAVSYHYVRRKRQITRYRNGDNYTTTQVYYERVNTHSATSHYYYDYCGVKDISKELILEPKIPITKIMLTKGFAFSNIRSATEFEEARSRFFAEQELSDDYMEMREGLDLGYNVNTMLVAVLGNPWFANRYVYWCLSALLLSWPLRVIIEYKTQYADYQVTKLFGVNYDTPTSGEPIHTSMSQLSQPGSYMLAPSYSEALLMEPATPRSDEPERSQEVWQPQVEADVAGTDMVPSYSEALLYERAEQFEPRNAIPNATVAAGNANDAAIPCKDVNDPNGRLLSPMPCECHCPCPCHGNKANENYDPRMDMRSFMHMTSREHLPSPGVPPTSPGVSDTYESDIATLRTTADGRLHPPRSMTPRSLDNIQAEASPSRCGSCGRISASTQTINLDVPPRVTVARIKPGGSSLTPPTDFVPSAFPSEREHGAIPRDISEPNLRSRSEPVNVPKGNVRSLENILENEEAPMKSVRAGSAASTATSFSHDRPFAHSFERQRRFPVSSRPPPLAHHRSLSLDESRNYYPREATGYGGIPRPEPRSRIMVNPMSSEDACWKLPNSRTYFCLKSILKQNNRRYTLVTADEFQNLADQNPAPNQGRECVVDNFGRSEKGSDVQPDRPDDRPRSRERLNPRRRMPSFEEFMSARDKAYNYYQKPESTRTLIFASPIQEVFPGDPFGGRDIVPVRNLTNPASGLAFARPSRSPVTRDFPTDSIPPAFRPDSTVYPSFVAHPSCRHERELQQHHSHSRFPFDRPSNSVDANVARVQTEETPRAYRHDFSLPPPYGGPTSERARNRRSISTSSNEPDDLSEDRLPNLYMNRRHQQAGLTRSCTERRRPKLAHVDRNFRRSFTGRVEDYRTENGKRTNFSMETSL